jgi:hypothetical protein
MFSVSLQVVGGVPFSDMPFGVVPRQVGQVLSADSACATLASETIPNTNNTIRMFMIQFLPFDRLTIVCFVIER